MKIQGIIYIKVGEHIDKLNITPPYQRGRKEQSLTGADRAKRVVLYLSGYPSFSPDERVLYVHHTPALGFSKHSMLVLGQLWILVVDGVTNRWNAKK